MSSPPFAGPLSARLCAISLAAAVLAAGLLAPLAAQDPLSTAISDLELERRLLAEELRLFSAAREAQQQALTAFAAALAAVDARIEGRSVSVEGLEALEQQVEVAEASLEAANRRASRWRLQLQDRLRTTALLESRAEGLSRGFGVRVDPLSGRWRLELEPGGEGFLDLRFSANLITGFYALEDGTTASLRGTYSGGELRLERVESLRGFDAVFVGEVDPASRTITGTWTATELSGGEPVRGSWRARKVGAIGSGATAAAESEEGEAP